MMTTIDSWHVEEQENLRRFVEWWKEQALIDAKVFPLRMEYDDWTEQYLYFLEKKEGN